MFSWLASWRCFSISVMMSSGLSRFAELVGHKGKLDNWVGEVGQYSHALLTFLKLIADEVTGYRAKVSFHDEAKPGLTKWFIVTAWNDAIQKASGYFWIDTIGYDSPECKENFNLWQLQCCSYTISRSEDKQELDCHKKLHVEIRKHFTENTSVKKIEKKRQQLNNYSEEIKQRLYKFADM